MKTSPIRTMLGRVLLATFTLALLYASFSLYLHNQALLGVVLLIIALGVFTVFGTRRFYTARFIFPGVTAVLLFIAFPVIYTIYLGFTNYSSFNLLSYERATEVLLQRAVVDARTERDFQVLKDEQRYRLYFPTHTDAARNDQPALLTEVVSLDGASVRIEAEALTGKPSYTALSRKEALQLRKAIAEITVVTPEGSELKNAGLRRFAKVQAEYLRGDKDSLISTADGMVLTANHSDGFYTTPDGTQVTPGWRVWVGVDNFSRIVQSEGIRGPIVSIFIWTIVFALLSVGLTFALGLLLASILQWPHLAGRNLYRLLLILPYAVPAFISILVFRGLFNQNFGEINVILNALFGIRPEWFTDGGLARLMIVIVNVWLGYPYMMLLAMGFLQSVPADHKKAAALEGAGVMRVFTQITLPQIIPPFLPLLIASFAFNFNNIVLVLLLTGGQPDILGTVIPAGQTDILGSFTYRIAFNDSSQQFGLAGAITFLIFIVVGFLAYANFVAMRRASARRFQGA